MHKRMISLALLCTLACLSATPTQAVSVFNFRIQAKIPFDFQIGSKKFPKGEYIIESVNPNGLMRISHEKGKKNATFLGIRDKQNSKMKTRLSFRRYGEQYFLRKVWDGQDAIFELERSSAEKKVAKALKGKEDAEGDEVDN